jgi:guanyl-specific ribonuclease Sa
MTMWIRIAALLALAFLAAEWWTGQSEPASTVAVPGTEAEPTSREGSARYPAFLPPEAIVTLELIEQGGPFPYDRDGTTFQNRERRLPDKPRGYYREYTVATPGSSDRGARRIVAGGQPPEVYYYTQDHYQSFRPVKIGP